MEGSDKGVTQRRPKPLRDRATSTLAPGQAVGGVVWSPPLMDRSLNLSDRTAELSAEFREAIVRIEGMYDPTRLDGTGQIPRMVVRAGTASMNNVFADRWSIADTDANVDYRVRYIAEAWQKHGIKDCSVFNKRRLVFGVPSIGNLSLSDCVRLDQLVDHREDLLIRLRIVGAVLDVPVFAAPAPGARLSSEAFWQAQEARIAAIKTNLWLKRNAGLSIGVTP